MSGRNERGPPLPDAGAEHSNPSSSLEPVFERLRAGLHQYLLRHLHRPEDVEDLTQEVYLRLFRFTDREKVKSPQAYLFRVAFNVLYEFKHHRNRSPVAFDSPTVEEATEHLPDEAERPEEIYLRLERRDEIKKLVETLPPMQRAVLLMSTRENLSNAHIARELGISASTARVHLFRAMAHLRESVSKE